MITKKNIFFTILLFCLFFFLSSKFKILINFTLFDLFATLLGITIIIFSFINLFFLKKKFILINIILVFIIFIFQAIRLNNFNLNEISKEQQCVYANLLSEKNKNNQSIKNNYLNLCKDFRN